MGTDCFVHHAYGVLLENYDDDLAAQIGAAIELNGFRERHEVTDDAAGDQLLVDEGVLTATPDGPKFKEWLTKDLAPRSPADKRNRDAVLLGFFYNRVVAALTKAGIRPMNTGWDLFWTGQDHAARCDAPQDAVIVGYGMMMHDPWKTFGGRSASKAFKKACRHYTWAELG